MKQTTTMLLLFFLVTGSTAQDSKQKKGYYRFAISNSHSAKPFHSFSSLFYKNFHPGVDIGYESILKGKNKHQYLLASRLSYMFHRWVQHNLSVSVDGSYRYAVTPSWSADLKIGGGYQLSIPQGKVYVITGTDGLRQKRNLGRSQAIGRLALAISKDLRPPYGPRLFLEYQQQLQAPFIKEYVPILPYNSLLIGIALPR